jgi:hypothetical protein
MVMVADALEDQIGFSVRPLLADSFVPTLAFRSIAVGFEIHWSRALNGTMVRHVVVVAVIRTIVVVVIRVITVAGTMVAIVLVAAMTVVRVAVVFVPAVCVRVVLVVSIRAQQQLHRAVLEGVGLH